MALSLYQDRTIIHKFYLRKQKDPRGKFGSWIPELEEYHYTVENIPAEDNAKANLLLRSQAANGQQPQSSFEDKIYAMMIDKSLLDKSFRHTANSDADILFALGHAAYCRYRRHRDTFLGFEEAPSFVILLTFYSHDQIHLCLVWESDNTVIETCV